MKPQSAKWREPKPEKYYTGKYLRPLNKYRHAKSLEDYYWQRVIKTESCWGFTAAGDKNGYPQVVGSKHCKQLGLTRGHQVAWYVNFGEIPEDMIVCHKCDNPSCVNPDHLFLGTWNDNVQDMMRKGRYVSGSKPTKCPPEVREKIREDYGKMNSFEAAKKYGISFSYVCSIWRGDVK